MAKEYAPCRTQEAIAAPRTHGQSTIHVLAGPARPLGRSTCPCTPSAKEWNLHGTEEPREERTGLLSTICVMPCTPQGLKRP
eukprot:3728521-Pleurochrysis_carterae.AAC.1